MNTRAISSAALAATLTIGALITAPRAHSAITGPVVSGTGWKIAAPGITHLDTQPWVIAFHDTASRTKLTPYLRNTAAELTSHLGVKITVTTRIVPASKTTCTRGHVITYRYMSKPNPERPNQSFAVVCGNNTQAADGASIYINSDYWSPTRRFREYQRMNVIWHESAHAIGLSHPDTCPKDRYGRQPIMCADQPTHTGTRRYSAFDTAGLKQLVKNRAYYTATNLLP